MEEGGGGGRRGMKGKSMEGGEGGGRERREGWVDELGGWGRLRGRGRPC